MLHIPGDCSCVLHFIFFCTKCDCLRSIRESDERHSLELLSSHWLSRPSSLPSIIFSSSSAPLLPLRLPPGCRHSLSARSVGGQAAVGITLPSDKAAVAVVELDKFVSRSLRSRQSDADAPHASLARSSITSEGNCIRSRPRTELGGRTDEVNALTVTGRGGFGE